MDADLLLPDLSFSDGEQIWQVEVSSGRNFTYLIADLKSHTGAIIDPSGDTTRLLNICAQHQIKPTHLFNTHGHHDHIGGNDFFRQQGLLLAAHPAARSKPDHPCENLEVIKIGQVPLQILHTPGHSADSICLVTGHVIFTGDTLFVGDCGRVDLPESNVEQMHISLLTILRAQKNELTVLPGHNYGPARFRTLEEEKRLNPTLASRTLDEFVAFMVAP